MTIKIRLKKGDKVQVISGKHKGDSGEITKIDRQKYRAFVNGLNLVRKHVKPSKDSPGKIESREASINLSNLAYLDQQDNKVTKIGYKVNEEGKKVRFAKRTGSSIDG